MNDVLLDPIRHNNWATVCAMLTALGIEPPDVQAWEYAWATVRLRQRTPG